MKEQQETERKSECDLRSESEATALAMYTETYRVYVIISHYTHNIHAYISAVYISVE